MTLCSIESETGRTPYKNFKRGFVGPKPTPTLSIDRKISVSFPKSSRPSLREGPCTDQGTKSP